MRTNTPEGITLQKHLCQSAFLKIITHLPAGFFCTTTSIKKSSTQIFKLCEAVKNLEEEFLVVPDDSSPFQFLKKLVFSSPENTNAADLILITVQPYVKYSNISVKILFSSQKTISSDCIIFNAVLFYRLLESVLMCSASCKIANKWQLELLILPS